MIKTNSKYTLANTLALTTSILWILCALFVSLLPGLALQITRWWMHGLNIDVLGSWDMTLPGFLLGGIFLALSAWITGFTFTSVQPLFKNGKIELGI